MKKKEHAVGIWPGCPPYETPSCIITDLQVPGMVYPETLCSYQYIARRAIDVSRKAQHRLQNLYIYSIRIKCGLTPF